MPASTISAHSAARILRPRLETADRGTPAYRRLAAAVRGAALDGQVLQGTRLPSERELAGALGVSRTTVTHAYAALRDAGLLRSQRGSGSVLTLPEGAPTTSGPISPAPPGASEIDLTCAAPPAVTGLGAAYERAVPRLPDLLRGTGYSPLGLTELREALARRYAERGLPTHPDEIMVTSGALSGTVVVHAGLASAGDRVLVETPTYPNAIGALGRGGVRLLPLPMTPTGWDVPGLEALLRQGAPRLAYLVPDHHNPTGLVMDDPTRDRVGAALARARCTPVIDESHVDMRLSDAPVPAPFGAHSREAVSIGSVSKCYWGGLRIGWIRAPRNLIRDLLDVRITLDLGAAPLEQLVVVDLLGRHEELMAERRQQLSRQRDALVAGLRQHLPDWRFTLPSGGLALWVRLPEPAADLLVEEAAARAVTLAGPGHFTVGGRTDAVIRIAFTRPVPELAGAVLRLRDAWDAATSRRPGARRHSPTPVLA